MSSSLQFKGHSATQVAHLMLYTISDHSCTLLTISLIGSIMPIVHIHKVMNFFEHFLLDLLMASVFCSDTLQDSNYKF